MVGHGTQLLLIATGCGSQLVLERKGQTDGKVRTISTHDSISTVTKTKSLVYRVNTLSKDHKVACLCTDIEL